MYNGEHATSGGNRGTTPCHNSLCSTSFYVSLVFFLSFFHTWLVINLYYLDGASSVELKVAHLRTTGCLYWLDILLMIPQHKTEQQGQKGVEAVPNIRGFWCETVEDAQYGK